MKHGKRPTRAQKILLHQHNLSPDNWIVVKDCPAYVVIVNRCSRETRTLNRAQPLKGGAHETQG